MITVDRDTNWYAVHNLTSEAAEGILERFSLLFIYLSVSAVALGRMRTHCGGRFVYIRLMSVECDEMTLKIVFKFY